MRLFSKLLVNLLLLAGINAAFSQTEAQPLQIPNANAVAIDGKLGEDEWKNALKQELVGGGELRLQHDGIFLYEYGNAGNNRISNCRQVFTGRSCATRRRICQRPSIAAILAANSGG